MNNKEILQNAPEGATHFYMYFGDARYFKIKEKLTNIWGGYERHHKSGWISTGKFYDLRSLSDIKALVEKDERIAELESLLEVHRDEKKNEFMNLVCEKMQVKRDLEMQAKGIEDAAKKLNPDSFQAKVIQDTLLAIADGLKAKEIGNE